MDWTQKYHSHRCPDSLTNFCSPFDIFQQWRPGKYLKPSCFPRQNSQRWRSILQSRCTMDPYRRSIHLLQGSKDHQLRCWRTGRMCVSRNNRRPKPKCHRSRNTSHRSVDMLYRSRLYQSSCKLTSYDQWLVRYARYYYHCCAGWLCPACRRSGLSTRNYLQPSYFQKLIEDLQVVFWRDV